MNTPNRFEFNEELAKRGVPIDESIAQNDTNSQERKSVADVSEEDFEAKYQESQRALKKMEAEYKAASEQAQYWHEQTKIREKKHVKKEDIRRFGRELLQAYPYTTVKPNIEFFARLAEIGNLIMNEGDSKEAYDKAFAIARDIIENSYAKFNDNYEPVPLDDETETVASRVYGYLKGQIYVSEAAQRDIATQLGYDSFKEVRNKFLGKRVYFTKDTGARSLDSIYTELTDVFGEGRFPNKQKTACILR